MTRSTVASLWLLLFLTSGTLLAQQQSSAIEGVIKDTSGAVIPGVTVEATSRANGVLVTTTESSGIYRFPRLPIGVYTIRASLSGYKITQSKDIDLVLGRTVTVNLTLQLNPLSEEITVTAVAPLVDVTQSGTATSIAREQLELLPKGRDFASVVGLAPGASNEPFLAGISIDGASGSENRYVIDAIDTTHPQGGTQGQGFITDFLEEVQVKTAGYDTGLKDRTNMLLSVGFSVPGSRFPVLAFRFRRRPCSQAALPWRVKDTDCEAATCDESVSCPLLRPCRRS